MDMFGGADYEYQVIGNVVVIIDLNQGGRSVTNDIENVLDSIGKDVDLADKKLSIVIRAVCSMV